MADTKISALTAIDAVAAGDEFPANDVSVSASKKVTATQLAAFAAPIATQANQETGTDVTTLVTSGRQHFHPSAAKIWVKWTANSTSILLAYNVSDIADTNVGDADGTIVTDFSSANWAGMVSVLDATAAWDATYTEACGFNAMAAGTFGVLCARMTDGGTAVAEVIDPDAWMVIGFGDHA